jgi:hypothetical protein
MRPQAKLVLVLGLFAMLAQLIFPPKRIIGHTTDQRTVVAYKRQPIWEGVRPIVWVKKDDGTGEGIIFAESAEVAPSQLVVPLGVTLVLTALGLLFAPRDKTTAP